MRDRIDFDPKAHQALVADFECGDDPWAKEVSNWIKAPPTEPESAARMVTRKKGFKVWLFVEDDGTLVGFTSLHKERWYVRDKSAEPILYLPFLGISTVYQGKKEPVQGTSYLKILFADLLYEARARINLKCSLLGLHVDKRNAKAKEIYEQVFGFAVCGEEDGYYRMFVDLGPPA